MRSTRQPKRVLVESGQGDHEAYWSHELEQLHEESSRSHFLDVWTRQAILDSLPEFDAEPLLLDLGCSSGYLLEDLSNNIRGAQLLGLDFIFSGLAAAKVNLPTASLLQGDVCSLPFADASIGAVVSANLLEHVPNDRAALIEIARVLRPGATAVFVVPASPNCYDYYDRYLHHQRRYRAGELASLAKSCGFSVVGTLHLGWTIYPLFWLVKKRNRWMYDNLSGEELGRRVARDIANTRNSSVGRMTCRIERSLAARHITPRFGIRELTILQHR